MTSLTPRPADPGRLAVTPSRRGWRIAAYAVILLAMLALLALVRTHPEALPTSRRRLLAVELRPPEPLATSSTRVQAESPMGRPVYVGVYGTPADFDRTLHVSGVRVFASSTSEVTIVPHVCHGGSVSVTTTPATFCRAFGPTEGATLEAGDEIVLEVTG